MRTYIALLIVTLISVLIISNEASAKVNVGKTYTGKASWYGPGFHGRKTASGERFNQNAMTAAHRSLPFGTMVKVTNKTNGKSVKVRINDRGPFKAGRIIDLSKAANNVIDCHLCKVEVKIISTP